MLFKLWLIALIGCVSTQKVLIPKSNGRYDVTIRTSELIDYSRSSSERGPRRMMVSVFSPKQPGESSCRSPDFLPKVARYYGKEFEEAYNISVDFSRLVLPYCSFDVTYGDPTHYAHSEDEKHAVSSLPLVLFSPGSGATRFRYNAICAGLASTGFLVVSIDHPYTVDIIQFPDGTTVKMPPNVTEDLHYLETHLQPRVKDASFILDSVNGNATLSRLLFPIATPNMKQVGIWGHSFGGAVAAQAIYEDKRFLGGINLDGSMVGSVVRNGFAKPFMLWESVGHTRKSDPTWAQFYPKLTGFKRNLETKHTEHNSFTDGPLLADLLGYSKKKTYLGSIDGRRNIEIISAYGRDFFQFTLLGDKPGLVQRRSKRFPEVKFIP